MNNMIFKLKGVEWRVIFGKIVDSARACLCGWHDVVHTWVMLGFWSLGKCPTLCSSLGRFWGSGVIPSSSAFLVSSSLCLVVPSLRAGFV